MRFAWERGAAVLLSVGLWAIVLAGGRLALNLMRGEVHALTDLVIRRGGWLV
jgi:hypothetical protein